MPLATTGRSGPTHTRPGGHEVLVAFATRVGVVLLGMVVQALLARLLLPEGRGGFAICVALATLLGMLFTPGAQQGAQQLVMTRETDVSEGTSCAFVICVVGGALAAVLAMPLFGSDIAYFEKATRPSFHWALALVPIVAFATAVEHQLAALRRFDSLALVSLLRTVTNVLAVIVLVWALALGVEGALAALAVANLAMIASCLWYLRRRAGFVFRRPKAGPLRRILNYGLRYHVARAGEAIGPHMGVLALGLFAAESDIGIFAVAGSLMVAFMLVSNAVGNVLLPRIAVLDDPENPGATDRARARLVALCLRLVCAATAAALLAMLVVSGPLVSWLYSDAFLPVVPLLWIIAPGMLANACVGMYMTYFKAVNKPETCSWTFVLGLVAELFVLIWLFPLLGVAAAAWAMTSGWLCRFLALSWLFHRRTGFGWARTWAPRWDDVVFLSAAARRLLRQSP